MIKNTTLGEKVHQTIRDQVLSGRYKPGERLFFEVIAKEFGVSMTSIKEAFMLLEREGLVVTIARKGTFVRELSKRDILEYYQIRNVVEGLAVDLICERGLSPENVEKLIDCCDSLQQHIEEKDAYQCIADDVAFHKHLVESSDNHQLYNLVSSLPLTNLFIFARKSEYYLKIGELSLEQHREIIRLLLKRKSKPIKQILKSHMTAGDHTIMVAMES